MVLKNPILRNNRWTVLIIVAVVMMMGYVFWDIMSPLSTTLKAPVAQGGHPSVHEGDGGRICVMLVTDAATPKLKPPFQAARQKKLRG